MPHSFSSVHDGVHVGSPLGTAGNTHHMSNKRRNTHCFYERVLINLIGVCDVYTCVHDFIITLSCICFLCVVTFLYVCVCVRGVCARPEIPEHMLNGKCTRVKQ